MGGVAYLAVPHVLIGGEADGGTVSKNRPVVVGTLRGEGVHRGRLRDVAGVVLILDLVFAPAVQDAHQHGLLLGDDRVRSEFHLERRVSDQVRLSKRDLRVACGEGPAASF